MRKCSVLVAGAAVALAGLMGTPGSNDRAEAFTVIPFPFFTPIAECGTVGTAQGFYDLDGDGQPDDCLAWFADSGGAYLVGGLEAFNVGDRVFVDGLVCNTCLTTCAAGAILNATLSACGG